MSKIYKTFSYNYFINVALSKVRDSPVRLKPIQYFQSDCLLTVENLSSPTLVIITFWKTVTLDSK